MGNRAQRAQIRTVEEDKKLKEVMLEVPCVVGGLDEYVSVCSRCGCALKEMEIAGNMKGTFQDFETRKTYPDSAIHFCHECKEAILKYANDPVRKAWLRMQALEHP